MIRKQEDIFKKEIKAKDFSDQELIQKMVENPKLIHRSHCYYDGKPFGAILLEELEQL